MFPPIPFLKNQNNLALFNGFQDVCIFSCTSNKLTNTIIKQCAHSKEKSLKKKLFILIT